MKYLIAVGLINLALLAICTTSMVYELNGVFDGTFVMFMWVGFGCFIHYVLRGIKL